VKVRGTVAAESTLDPAFADAEAVMSRVVLFQAGGTHREGDGVMGGGEGTVAGGPLRGRGRDRDRTGRTGRGPPPERLRGSRADRDGRTRGWRRGPRGVDAAFTDPGDDLDAVAEALSAEADEEAAELADDLRQAQTDGGAVDVLDETSPLRAGVPQKFEEQFAASGDEVYVVGKAADGRLTNRSAAFQVRHESSSAFELLKGLAGGVALTAIGLAAGYGAVN
jgi:hypothetical protein